MIYPCSCLVNSVSCHRQWLLWAQEFNLFKSLKIENENNNKQQRLATRLYLTFLTGDES